MPEEIEEPGPFRSLLSSSFASVYLVATGHEPFFIVLVIAENSARIVEAEQAEYGGKNVVILNEILHAVKNGTFHRNPKR